MGHQTLRTAFDIGEGRQIDHPNRSAAMFAQLQGLRGGGGISIRGGRGMPDLLERDRKRRDKLFGRDPQGIAVDQAERQRQYALQQAREGMRVQLQLAQMRSEDQIRDRFSQVQDSNAARSLQLALAGGIGGGGDYAPALGGRVVRGGGGGGGVGARARGGGGGGGGGGVKPTLLEADEEQQLINSKDALKTLVIAINTQGGQPTKEQITEIQGWLSLNRGKLLPYLSGLLKSLPGINRGPRKRGDEQGAEGWGDWLSNIGQFLNWHASDPVQRGGERTTKGTGFYDELLLQENEAPTANIGPTLGSVMSQFERDQTQRVDLRASDSAYRASLRARKKGNKKEANRLLKKAKRLGQKAKKVSASAVLKKILAPNENISKKGVPFDFGGSGGLDFSSTRTRTRDEQLADQALWEEAGGVESVFTPKPHQWRERPEKDEFSRLRKRQAEMDEAWEEHEKEYGGPSATGLRKRRNTSLGLTGSRLEETPLGAPSATGPRFGLNDPASIELDPVDPDAPESSPEKKRRERGKREDKIMDLFHKSIGRKIEDKNRNRIPDDIDRELEEMVRAGIIRQDEMGALANRLLDRVLKEREHGASDTMQGVLKGLR